MLKISVIIPSYNQGKFLEETIQSVLSQEYPLLELFVIDGGSTDNSSEIIKKYEKQLTGFIIEKDKGQSEAINKGLKMCTGDIVTWLCSDDLYTQGTLHKVNEVFSSLTDDTGLIHGNSVIFQGDKIINNDKGYGNWNIERQLAGMTFPQPSAFMRKKTLLKAGILNTRFHYGMDYDLFSRMRLICKFHYEDFFFSRYRLHDASKSTTAIAKFIDEWIIIFNSIVKGLSIPDLLQPLQELGLETETDKSIFDFCSSLPKTEKINHEKMLFYFLVNVIRYDYATDNYKRARRIGKYIRNTFGDYLRDEPTIIKIISRTYIFPPSILKLIRKVKRSLSNK